MRLLGGLAITVMTLYCAPRGRRGKGRSIEGSGLYPELAAYRISEGSSPNVQAEVGRLVGQLPIEQARAELARRGLELDEKAVRRIAGELGEQMLATRTRDLLRFRAGDLPAGDEFAGKRVAVGIDGGRVRVRTVIEKIRVSGKKKRRKFRIEWREPKVLIVFQTDEKGRMANGSRPVIDGTLQGPVGLGNSPGQTGPGPGSRGARLVSRRASPEPGVGGIESGPGSAPGALQPATRSAQGRQEPGCAGRTRGFSGGPGQGRAGMARDRLLDQALRGGPTALRLFPVPGCTAGQWCDREYDPPRDQPPAQGEQYLLDGGQCGSGVPTAGGRRVGTMGRDRGAHA